MKFPFLCKVFYSDLRYGVLISCSNTIILSLRRTLIRSVDISEVNAFMKQFEQMRDMMKGMNKAGMFGGKMMPGMKR